MILNFGQTWHAAGVGMPVLAWSEVALVALFTIGVAARFYWHRAHPAEESTLERDALRADDRAELTVTDHATLLMDDDGITVNQVNEYSLTRVLGSGSFSQVRLATDGRKMYAFKMIRRKTLERPKLLLRRPAAPDGGAVCSKRQLAEVALMRKLSHPNVVRLFEVIDDAKLPSIFLVLELVRGGTLAEPIKKRRCVADAELRRWLRGVVLGLEHLHFHGVAHRDVKPDNILWCLDTCEPKLTDFGMSSGFDSHRLGGDHVRATGGTMGFFAPEMCTPRVGPPQSPHTHNRPNDASTALYRPPPPTPTPTY